MDRQKSQRELRITALHCWVPLKDKPLGGGKNKAGGSLEEGFKGTHKVAIERRRKGGRWKEGGREDYTISSWKEQIREGVEIEVINTGGSKYRGKKWRQDRNLRGRQGGREGETMGKKDGRKDRKKEGKKDIRKIRRNR